MSLKQLLWQLQQSIRISRGLFLAACLLIACLMMVSCRPAAPQLATKQNDSEGKLRSILDRGVLVIATDSDYPPQSKLDTSINRAGGTRCDISHYTANQLTGFDVAVAIEIAHRLGVEPCFVTPAWSQIIAGSWGDRWDINVGSMAIIKSRMKNLYFTQPYTTGQAAAFIHEDNHQAKELSDLSGKKIGVCAGCAYEAYLNETLEIPGEEIDYMIKDAEIIGYDTDTSALADLAAGNGLRLDAVLTDPDTGRTAIENGLPVKQLNGPVYYDYVAVSIDKSSSQDAIPLQKRLNEIILAMHADGTLRELSNTYYGADFTSPAAEYDVELLGQD